MVAKKLCKGKTRNELLICKSHHRFLDEMLNDSTKRMHDMLDDAYKTGALTEEFKENNHLLPKAIITIWCRKDEYAPFALSTKRDVTNLERFI